MRRLFYRGKKLVSFCERCGQFCDASCRLAALRERALSRQLWPGVRI
jgi:hypothetical protein